MKELKGTQTERNLWTAFAAEAQAHTKYQYYASRARKDGYEQMAAIFAETSANEKEHGKLWFKLLHGGNVPDTMENLLDAAAGENHEWSELYAGFARTAREEGFETLARQLDGVANVENAHEARYRRLIERMEQGEVFVRDGKIAWLCRNCGHIHVGAEAPELCPVCSHPRAYFEQQAKNY